MKLTHKKSAAARKKATANKPISNQRSAKATTARTTNRSPSVKVEESIQEITAASTSAKQATQQQLVTTATPQQQDTVTVSVSLPQPKAKAATTTTTATTTPSSASEMRELATKFKSRLRNAAKRVTSSLRINKSSLNEFTNRPYSTTTPIIGGRSNQQPCTSLPTLIYTNNLSICQNSVLNDTTNRQASLYSTSSSLSVAAVSAALATKSTTVSTEKDSAIQFNTIDSLSTPPPSASLVFLNSSSLFKNDLNPLLGSMSPLTPIEEESDSLYSTSVYANTALPNGLPPPPPPPPSPPHEASHNSSLELSSTSTLLDGPISPEASPELLPLIVFFDSSRSSTPLSSHDDDDVPYSPLSMASSADDSTLPETPIEQEQDHGLSARVHSTHGLFVISEVKESVIDSSSTLSAPPPSSQVVAVANMESDESSASLTPPSPNMDSDHSPALQSPPLLFASEDDTCSLSSLATAMELDLSAPSTSSPPSVEEEDQSKKSVLLADAPSSLAPNSSLLLSSGHWSNTGYKPRLNNLAVLKSYLESISHEVKEINVQDNAIQMTYNDSDEKIEPNDELLKNARMVSTLIELGVHDPDALADIHQYFEGANSKVIKAAKQLQSQAQQATATTTTALENNTVNRRRPGRPSKNDVSEKLEKLKTRHKDMYLSRPAKKVQQQQHTATTNATSTEIIRCICTSATEEFGEMVQCDDCSKWLHLDCLHIESYRLRGQQSLRCPPCCIRIGEEAKLTSPITWRYVAYKKSEAIAAAATSNESDSDDDMMMTDEYEYDYADMDATITTKIIF